MSAGNPPNLKQQGITLLSAVLSLFILYTCATGPFESIIQRAIFLAILICLGVLYYPLWEGKKIRPLGMVVDTGMVLMSLTACVYVIVNYDMIMTTLPMAKPRDIVMMAALSLVILEIARRAIGYVFPTIVVIILSYALLGEYIPGRLGHRGFDIYFVTETLFLGDLGVWGMLMGVAATIIAAFTLFGSILLNTGGGQTFIDLAMRLGGRAPGGGAKIATIASGLFGMVSGSAVANVATTGNFTIPLMKRLGYPPPMAAGTEAVASTGGQLAPPIMGAAAFIMAEIIGVEYVTIILAASLPAFLFYLGVFMTIDVMAKEHDLGSLPDADVPPWKDILYWRRLTPVVVALGALFVGIFRGNAIQTAAFYGMAAALIAFPVTRIKSPADLLPAMDQITKAFKDSSRGLLIIGILLAGAQIMVAMINMTGLGITLSSLIVSLGGDSVFLVAFIVAVVCMIMGMGIPTTAAYVLVAAVLAPAMIKMGIAPIVAHLFVFYYATLSVITPPVCIAVFVGSGIAETEWTKTAKYALSFGAVTYVIPFLFIIYPGMLAQAGLEGFCRAAFSGILFVLAFANLFGGLKISGNRLVDKLLCLVIAVLAVLPGLWTSMVALLMTIALYVRRRQLKARRLKLTA
ncbi:TRAP transporter fused permease subunit [uncultured Desulfosarcina sp.]|uniref:TRAP transporter permease n=1 Tax=uncultured Desulfosarcina sp. TaxID=218289 RepID=UPI0029C6C1DF|nr:TRAP transporter fused permease subunit [uncultured Desulfosarcina sp.]